MQTSQNIKSIPGVKNLLFDLGGVIMEIKRELCVAALEKLGMSNANDVIGLYAQSGSFMALEDGSISEEQFYNDMRAEIVKCGNDASHVSNDDIKAAICEFLIGIPVERLHALQELRKHYKVYMLSNTNPVMFNSKISDEFAKEGLNVNSYFDGLCLSYEQKMAKPEACIFHQCEHLFGIKPEETLFFDDGKVNIDAAAALGFKTYLVTPDSEFMEAFK